MPDPDKDEVVAIFYSFYNSNFQRVDHDSPFNCESGIIAINNAQLNPLRLRNWTMDAVGSELDLLNSVVDIVQSFDPDIITGWEVQASSWGYLNARARSFGESCNFAVLSININIWACRIRLLRTALTSTWTARRRRTRVLGKHNYVHLQSCR